MPLRGLRSSTVWLREHQRITKHILTCNKLSPTVVTQHGCAASTQCKVLERHHNFTEHHSNPRNRYYMYTIVGVGTGLMIGAILKNCYNERNNNKKLFPHVLPSVCAASPFSFTSTNDLNTSETKPTTESTHKRLVHNFIADAVEKTSEKVVYIEIKDSRRSSFVRFGQALSNGSGFIVSEDGLILTNAHVVTSRPRSSSIWVRLHDGSECEGIVEDIDAISDLALIRVKHQNLTPAQLGKSSELRPGEFVAALGSPLSLCNTVTAGVVSSVGRASKELGLHGRDIQYIQTDAAITYGNSGGPLINMDGEVIGINSMTVTSGISFAIPIDYAKEFIAQAHKKRTEIAKYPQPQGNNHRRYLGITMLSLTPTIMQELQSRGSIPGHHIPTDLNHGILVWKIVVGSPAYQAGLLPGDIITHINNHEIHSSRDVYKFLEGRGELNMTVVRNGQRYFVNVVPEE